ncbi:BQ2448_5859 [Microbotryum intermedium]|uniref:BQ2448_5859 protein n=1 Tax=Microbotryum intermedium TaxID=269621 RepID=A0A238F5Q1_9BASI|nr:BQ2448_5859 [Microbotryum intermedium]
MVLEPSFMPQNVAIASLPGSSLAPRSRSAFESLPHPPSSTFLGAAQPSYDMRIQQQAEPLSRVSTTTEASARPARVERFLHKMMRLLRQPDDDGFDIREYIHWDSTGTVLVVPDEQALANNVCRRVFSQSNVSSFDKQLNNWGFLRYKPSPFDPRDTSEFERLGPRSRIWQHQSLTRDSTVEEVFAVKRKEDGMYKRRLMSSRSWSVGTDGGGNNVAPGTTPGSYPRRSTRTRNRPSHIRSFCTSDEDSSAAEDAARHKHKVVPAPKLSRVYSAPPFTDNHGRSVLSTLRRGSLDSIVHRTFRKAPSFDSFDSFHSSSSRSPTRSSPREPQLSPPLSSASPSHYTTASFVPGRLESSDGGIHQDNLNLSYKAPLPVISSIRPDELPQISPWRRSGSSALSHFYDLTANVPISAPRQIRRCVTPTRSTWHADDSPAVTLEERASEEMDGYPAAACLAKLQLGAQHHTFKHVQWGSGSSLAAS